MRFGLIFLFLLISPPAKSACPTAVITALLPSQAGLAPLVQGHKRAEATEKPITEFAVSFSDLQRASLTRADLVWLLHMGWVTHLEETTAAGDLARNFAENPSMFFTESSYFVLTPEGIPGISGRQALQATSQKPRVPTWDSERRELRVGEQVVKQFRIPAPQQIAILDAFEKAGWPASIKNATLAKADQVETRVLNDTIRNLNRSQRGPIRVVFGGDGTGKKVLWTFEGPE